jgi:hypothetical protein
VPLSLGLSDEECHHSIAINYIRIETKLSESDCRQEWFPAYESDRQSRNWHAHAWLSAYDSTYYYNSHCNSDRINITIKVTTQQLHVYSFAFFQVENYCFILHYIIYIYIYILCALNKRNLTMKPDACFHSVHLDYRSNIWVYRHAWMISWHASPIHVDMHITAYCSTYYYNIGTVLQ